MAEEPGSGLSSDDGMRDWERTLHALRESEQSTASGATPTERLQAVLASFEADQPRRTKRTQRKRRNWSRATERAQRAERRLAESEWREAGLCWDCGERPRWGSHFCRKHEDAGRARIKERERADRVRRRTRKDRPAVYSRDGGYCRYCGVELDEAGEWHVDHIEPVYRGGGSEMENLALACADCNLSKGTRSPAEFLAELERGSLAAFLAEPRRRRARDGRNAMIALGCALTAGIIMFVAVALPTSRVGGFFAALAAFVLTVIVVAVVVRGPRCETCSAPPVEGASLCGAHLAAQRRAVHGRRRRSRRRNYWAR